MSTDIDDMQLLALSLWHAIRADCQNNLTSACCRWGISIHMAQAISQLSILDVQRLAAGAGFRVWQLRIDEAQLATLRSSPSSAMGIMSRLLVGDPNTKKETENA